MLLWKTDFLVVKIYYSKKLVKQAFRVYNASDKKFEA